MQKDLDKITFSYISEYSELQKIKRELSLLQKLYGLYNAVIDSINGYYEILWTDLDIEKINNELLDFQNRLVSFLIAFENIIKNDYGYCMQIFRYHCHLLSNENIQRVMIIYFRFLYSFVYT